MFFYLLLFACSLTCGAIHSASGFLTSYFVTVNAHSCFSFTIGLITMYHESAMTSRELCRAVFRSTSSRFWIQEACVVPRKSHGIGSFLQNKYEINSAFPCLLNTV